MYNGDERISHWNKLKVVSQDSDLSFRKLNSGSNAAFFFFLQDEQNGTQQSDNNHTLPYRCHLHLRM